MNALLIEQDAATVKQLNRLLTQAGYEILYCPNFEGARLLAEETSPDLLLLNLDEPRDASLQFCRWFRARSGAEAAWIIGLVAGKDASPGVAALSCGMDDLLAKPVEEHAARLRLLTAARQQQRARDRVTEQQYERQQWGVRAQQQVALAALGQCALAGVDLATLIERMAEFIAQTVEVEHVAVYEWKPDSAALEVIGGAGFPTAGGMGLRLAADASSPEGATLRNDPVFVADRGADERFPSGLEAAGHTLRGGLSVIIPGPDECFGVLAIYSRQVRSFTADDAGFLKAAAIVLSLAIDHHRNAQSLLRLAAFARCNPNPVLEIDAEGRLMYANAAAEEAARAARLASGTGLLPENYAATARLCLESGRPQTEQLVTRGRGTLAWSFFPACETGTVHCYGEDVSNRLHLETQLRQLQKMECVGQLAAGLAHDFNNVLTIIRGHADLIMLDPSIPEKRLGSLKKIVAAGERGSAITRQLLAFSRRQPLDPLPLDLNENLGQMIRMLDRVLGSNIQVDFQPGAELPSVLADSGMLDQVTMNLAVNARDAMPKGGRLAIATSFVEVDDAHVRRHPEAHLGKFICLSVSDTGCGMDEATLRRIFEPFFTTKPQGRGTGLGLATVYGIVKQHEGWIEVLSRPGEGTTFLIYLPCCGGSPAVARGILHARAAGGNGEGVLLVEDEPALRELARMILQNHGYHVLEAANAAQALRLWSREKNQIDLLLTDMLMPDGQGGADLARQLVAEKKSLRVIYTSGYSAEVMIAEGVGGEGRFLEKPYSAGNLLRIVREALDADHSEQGKLAA